jgi:dihydroxy-acid dehydratase
MVGHVAPEAFVGGPLAAVRDGDTITIDIEKRTLDLEIAASEFTERLRGWSPPPPNYGPTSALSKYARLVGSASQGAVTSA